MYRHYLQNCVWTNIYIAKLKISLCSHQDRIIIKPALRCFRECVWIHDSLRIGGELLVGDTMADSKKIKTREFSDTSASFRAFFDAVNDAILVHDAETGRILYVNHRMCTMFGYEEYDLSRLSIGELFLGASPLWLIKPLKDSSSICEWVARRKDHSVFDAEASASLIDTKGGARFVVIIRDISATKRIERELSHQLAEKETLLKEVHHRIKNNLASLESLMSMQTEALNNPEAIAALYDAMARVSGIRILYEKLLIQEDYTELAGKEYVETLIDTIAGIYPIASRLVLHKDIQEFNMDSKRLLSMGIVINELLSNAMKYAFTDRASGSIHCILHLEDNEITLSIHDNGKGFPEGFNRTGNSGFGLPLVSMICQQLGGSFASVGTGGTLNIVKIPCTANRTDSYGTTGYVKQAKTPSKKVSLA